MNVSDKERKKEVIRDLITRLHQGLSIEEAKEIFEKEVGTISSAEIAEVEQSLINEGLSPNEIKKFCNVHALLFKSALQQSVSKEESPTHPIFLFKLENREIEKITKAIKDVIEKKDGYTITQLTEKIQTLLTQLRGIDTHYTRKEQLIFPFLEKHGFTGPSNVMWGKDNEIRELLNTSIKEIKMVTTEKDFNDYTSNYLTSLLDEVEGMIFKEEKILFPASIEKLNIDDWIKVQQESNEVGYAFIEKPEATASLEQDSEHIIIENTEIKDTIVSLPTGNLQMNELLGLLNTLPVDITFVGKDDAVKYFSDSKERIFVRTKSVLGRKVQNCHPPQSVDVVEKILTSFKEGKRDSADFWINFQGKLVYIKYFAVRDKEGAYLGTLEVTQDLTEIKKLEGEKRLLDERE